MDTRTLQERLATLGFSPGAVDGLPGPRTTAAIIRFQQARGLVSDGIVGPKTLAALFPPAVDASPAAQASAADLITAARIKAFAPSALPALVDALANADLDFAAAGIVRPLRVQHFFAQVAVESAGLVRLVEDLNYSAERLHQVWPKRFPSEAAAAPYAHNPEALANKVYGGRLGNTHPGDGWRYRGSGLMQVTGRENFRDAGHEDDPDALRTPRPALLSALWFWADHACNVPADADDVARVRHIVNGGENGLDDARAWLAKAKRVFV